jgi:hypothetical protein
MAARTCERLCLSAALLLSCLLSGCGENSCDSCRQSRIEGRVIGPAGPVVDALIVAELPVDIPEYGITIRTLTNERGEYGLAVPIGAYIVRAELPSGSRDLWYARPAPAYVQARAETLWVFHSDVFHRADFTLGGLEVNLHIPPEVEYESLHCSVFNRSTRQWVGWEHLSSGDPAPVFAFDDLAPGAYFARIQIAFPNGSSLAWLPSSMDTTEAVSFQVESLQVASWEGSLPPPGFIHGTVQGDWDVSGYSNPRIYVHGPDESSVADRKVDSDGEFDIPMFAPGSFRLKVQALGRSRWIGGSSYDDASESQVALGTAVETGPIGISSVRFHVVGNPDWEPYSGSILFCDESSQIVDVIQMGSSGEAFAGNLAPETYRLRLWSLGACVWRPQWYDRSPDFDRATPVAVPATGEQIDVSFVLEEGGKIRGRVVDSEGNGVPAQRLDLYAVNMHWSPYEGWETDSEGNFLIEGLPDDDIRIGIRHPDYSRINWYPGTMHVDSAAVITITNAEEVTGIVWQLCP